MEHQYWKTIGRKTAETGVPYADANWNYCDMKCLYFENLVSKTDFYVINFKDAIYKPNFSACYGRAPGGTPQLWNTFINNTWYKNNCGGDSEDWLAKNYEVIS